MLSVSGWYCLCWDSRPAGLIRDSRQRPDPTPTPLPPEPAVEQPTYIVQRGPVARELAFTARVAPVQEAQPYSSPRAT